MKKKNNSTHEIKRKKRQDKLAKKRNNSVFLLFKAVFVVGAVVAIIFLIYQSEIFTVTKVIIKGNKRLSEGQILKAAAPPKHSNYFNFPFKSLKNRIETLVWVEDVEINRSFPGGILINIKERQPFAYILSENLLFVVDFKGYIISIENYKRFKLPTIERMKIKKITVGKNINNDVFENVTKAYKSLPNDIKSKVDIISSPSEEELTFVVDGIEIIYGPSEQNQIKSSVIAKLLKLQSKEKLSSIDVRVPTQPVTRVIGK